MGEPRADPVAVVDLDGEAVPLVVARQHHDAGGRARRSASPVGAVTSMPSCGRFSCRIGWNRLLVNWLESHPAVGMMLGVFAKRSKLLCSVSETFAEAAREV